MYISFDPHSGAMTINLDFLTFVKCFENISDEGLAKYTKYQQLITVN